MRGPVTRQQQKDFNPPNWNIWEYVRRVPTTCTQICPDHADLRPPAPARSTSRRTTCPTGASCSRPRASSIRRGAAQRRQAGVRGPDRGPERIGVRAARDELRRHRPAPDHLQPEPRRRRHGAGERPRHVHAAGIMPTATTACICTPPIPTAPTCSCCTASAATTPPAPIPAARPRCPARRGLHGAVRARARDAERAACWRWCARSPTPTGAAI